MTKDDIAKMKANIEYWANNCGGCEECGRVFGDGDLTFDKETVYELIKVIENQETEIEELQADKVPCGPEPEKCGNNEAGFYQCRNHWNFYHRNDK